MNKEEYKPCDFLSWGTVCMHKKGDTAIKLVRKPKTPIHAVIEESASCFVVHMRENFKLAEEKYTQLTK